VRRERVLVLIIAYKFAKGGLWLALALAIAVAIRMGLGDRMRGLAEHLQHHAHAWSLRLAELLTRAATRRGLITVTVALVADGISSLIEGWALLHGRWWGPWLVVVTTSSFLPLEIAALARHPHPVRFALFAVNVAIVVYLARKALAERRDSANAPGTRTVSRPSG
jgi:uncharacterized membrane protein (DUF2068 family)